MPQSAVERTEYYALQIDPTAQQGFDPNSNGTLFHILLPVEIQSSKVSGKDKQDYIARTKERKRN